MAWTAEHYDLEFGYSVADFVRRSAFRAYEVPAYYVQSAEAIKRCMERGNCLSRSHCLEHLNYLQNLREKLSAIAVAERTEGVVNWQFHAFLEELRKLLLRLEAFAVKLDRRRTPANPHKQGLQE